MAETAQGVLDVQALLLNDKHDVQQYLLLRPAQGRAIGQRRQIERIVIELMENPAVDGKALAPEDAALVIGVGLWALGRLEEAIASLTSGSSAEADYFMGLCYLENGYFERAIEAFERADRGKSATKRCAAVGHTEATAKAGRPDAALTAARALVRSYPNEPAAHYALGLCYDLTGRYEDAISAYEKALELAPGHPAASFRLGYANAFRGDSDRALEHYASIAAGAATYINALLNLGVLYEDRRDYDRAIECYRRILKVEPTHGRARMYLKDAHASLDMVYDEDRQRELDRRNKLLGIPVSDFEFSVRVRNCLQRMNIHTLGDLARLSEEELLGSKNFGETSLQEIKEVLAARNLRLGEAKEEGMPHVALADEPAAAAGAAVQPDDSMLRTPISELSLSLRSRKCMERLGISTIGQLIEHTSEELLASRNFGRTSLAEVNEKLGRLGLALKETPPEEGEESDEDDGDLPPDVLSEASGNAE